MDVREKLVEFIGSTEYGNGYLIGNNFQKGFIEKIASHLIANGVTVQEWISVNDRWPDLELEEVKTDDNDLFPCLAVRKHQRVKNGKYTAKVWYDGYGFIDGYSIDVTDDITHWMPLPDPPKGE